MRVCNVRRDQQILRRQREERFTLANDVGPLDVATGRTFELSYLRAQRFVIGMVALVRTGGVFARDWREDGQDALFE